MKINLSFIRTCANSSDLTCQLIHAVHSGHERYIWVGLLQWNCFLFWKLSLLQPDRKTFLVLLSASNLMKILG